MSASDSLSGDQFGYRMQHRPPGPEDDVGAPFHQADDVMPDVTGPNGERYYDGHATAPHPVTGMGMRVPYSRSPSAESFRQVRAAKGNPDHEVHIYRALPKENAPQGIQPGDWVTPSRKYAEQHARMYEGTHAVIEGTARASELRGQGDDVNEWGYNPR